MRTMTFTKKKVIHIVVWAIIIIAIGLLLFNRSNKKATYSHIELDMDNKTILENVRQDSYAYYIKQYQDHNKPNHKVQLTSDNYDTSQSQQVSVLTDYEGQKNVLKTEEESFIQWTFQVAEEGLYNINIEYFPIAGKSSSIERELLINGEAPFFDARQLLFSRIWTDSEIIKQDGNGNDIRPRQIEEPRWVNQFLIDPRGYEKIPYYFYLKKGENTISLKSMKEPMVIRKVVLEQYEMTKDYEEVKASYDSMKTPETVIKLQGEEANYKSDPTLYPLYDRASPITEPYHPSKIKLNMIGSDKWKLPGQWIEWEVNIPADGYYKIALQQKQNIERGSLSYRRLYIDDKVPFTEMEAIPFAYTGDWKLKTLGNQEEDYRFYMTEGKHRIRLEITLGDLGEVLQLAEESVYQLNVAYRKILMLTGSEPDVFRDYQIHKRLPEVITLFEEQSDILYSLMNHLIAISGQKGSQVSVLEKLAYQLESLSKDPDSIAERMKALKDNIGGLGTWILSSREQPLSIDYLLVADENAELTASTSNIGKRLMHESRSFIASFTQDYNSIGDVAKDNEKSIDVWVLTGRDQAQIIKRLIDDEFTPKTGIRVNIRLVQGNVLLPATVSGRAPDVAMQVPMIDPVNYALRNAVVDLKQFDDYEQIKERFHESAIVPYRFNNGVYALPETQIFPIMFYRKDILEELGLSVPSTWEDYLRILPDIQKNHMNIGIPITTTGTNGIPLTNGIVSYLMYFYQLGGELYRDEGKMVNLDTKEAILAFEKWTEQFSSYKLPLKYNFVNRFRTGEMPIGIADYTTYNQLTVFAPEIRGLWGFAPIPGTQKEGGDIDRSIPSTGTCTIILEQSQEKDAAWEYLKWWTSEAIQEQFGREMESLMGAAARFPTANKAAVEKLPWPIQDYKNLMAQWNWVKGNPEVPGGYFVPRHIDNAFRKVVYDSEDPRETLLDYVNIINEEINKKRMEFGLPTVNDEGEEGE